MRLFPLLIAATLISASTHAIAQDTRISTAGQPFKSSGRTIQNLPSLRKGSSQLQHVPSKARNNSGAFQNHGEVSPSVATLPADALRKVRRAAGERTAQALLIHSNKEKLINKIISLPLSAGAVESFPVVANNIPGLPYKNYGEYIETAVQFDDKYMASTYCDMLYSQTNAVYTSTDWQLQYQYDYRTADLVCPAIAYSEVEGICYGIFQGVNPENGNDEWMFGRWIDPSTYTRPEAIRYIGTNPWFGIAISPDGTIYAIDSDCNLLKVDSETGESTKIGATGLTNQYLTATCYDPVSDRILFATSIDSGSAMNSIDPATGRSTMLYQMPDEEQIIGMFIPKAVASDKAPAAPTNLKADFEYGSLSGNIKFDVPATYFDGTAAAGSVSYEVRIEGKIASTGSASFGESVTAPITLEKSGSYVVTARVKNSVGDSPITRSTLFCGTACPRPPYFNGAVTYDDTEKCFNLSWSPSSNTSGIDGGLVINDDLTYELTRYPDMKVTNLGKGVTSLSDPFTPSGDLQIVYYELKAIYHGEKSGMCRSNAMKFGIINPPYTDEMMTGTSAAAYSYLTTANDRNEWSYIGPVSEQNKQHGWMYHGAYNGTNPMNSYLITSPIKLEKGKMYTLAFTAACTNTSMRNEKLAVYLGDEITEAGLKKQTLIEPTLIYERREENGERHSVNFTAPEDGVYYIAFHHCTEKPIRYLYIGDISISAPVDPQVPGEISNLTILADSKGRLQTSITFNLPLKSVNGTTLSEQSKVKIYRNGEMITDASPTTNYVSYTDNGPSNGMNLYEIVPYNSKGEGLHTTGNVFVGVGKPANPQGQHAWYGDNDGVAKVTWEPSTRDEFNTPLNSSNVRYDIQREAVLTNGVTERKVIKENLSELEYTDQYVNANAEQQSASYWVRAVTDGGTSQWVSTRKVGLGKPYSTPWLESFSNGGLKYNWHSVGSGLNWSIVSDAVYDDVKSVDGDDGFFIAQASKENTPGLFYSGAIEIPADMQNPVYSFYYLNQDKYQGVPVKNIVELVVLDANGQQHLNRAVCNGPWGWQRMTFDMSPYKGQKVQVGVYFECIDRPMCVFDAFKLSSRLANDIDMVSIQGPEEVEVGQNAVLTVAYDNVGANDIEAGYKVELYCNGQKIDEADGKAIRSDARTSLNFTVRTNPTMGEKPEYHVVVRNEGDNDVSNNTSNTYTLKVTNNIGYPEPRNLTAGRSANAGHQVELAWEAPDMEKTPRQAKTEDFESFESFAKAIDGWTILDEDKGIVVPISNYIQTSDTWGSAFGWFVQDNSVAPFDQYEEFKTTSGTKYMASQLTADSNGSPLQNDDWLISPELSGDRQIASFMGKSISASWPESFKVYYSTGGNSKDDFILIGGVQGAPNSWMHYTATLPEGSKYFAIQCISFNCLQFMVDDVTLRYASADPIKLTMQGYNIYRDGKLVNDTPHQALTFTDTADADSHRYMVTAVYAEGESMPSEASSVESGVSDIHDTEVSVIARNGKIEVTAPAEMPVTVCSTSGIILHKGRGCCSVAVASGVYIVKAGKSNYKIVVN